MPAIRLGEVEYSYRTVGTGQPAMLLHGFTGSSEDWDYLAEALSTTFRLFAVDLLGHGRSSAPLEASRYRIDRAAEDLRRFVHEIIGEHVHLLGYSMGGRLALYFALVYPELVRSLTLESASPGLKSEVERKERREADDRLAEMIERQGIVAFVDEWEKLPLFASLRRLPEASRMQVHERRLRNRPEGLAGSLRGLGVGIQPSLWGRLGELQMRMLLISGELDEKFCDINKRMANAIPGAQLQIIPGAGHTVHLEQPEKVAELVQRFWVEKEQLEHKAR